MEKKPINIGMVGIGRAGWGMHCPELANKESMFKITAACDLIEERRARMAERYGCATYERIEDLVKDPEVELVDIATRSCDHFAHAKMALLAGKAVFLEKPMCATYDEARELVEIAKSEGTGLFIRHNRRFEPAFQHIREIMASGILGDVREIKLRRVGYQRRDDWQTIIEFGGGQLLNWGPHIIDHALCFLDGKVKSMWSNLDKIAAVGDAEDHLKIVLTGESGCVVDLEISGGAAIGEPTYLVWGTRGALRSDEREITMRYIDPDQELAPRTADPSTPGSGTFGTPETINWVESTIPVAPALQVNTDYVWDALYGAIRDGKPYPITLEHALEVMRVASAAKKGTRFEMQVAGVGK